MAENTLANPVQESTTETKASIKDILIGTLTSPTTAASIAADILARSLCVPAIENKPESKKRHKKISGVYKRGNRWQIDATYKGSRIQERCATFEMAESALRKQKTLIDEGKYLDKKRESSDTLAQLGERYMAFCEGKRQKSLRCKKTNIKRILEHFGKESRVCKITMADVEAFQTALSATTASRKESALKPASVNRFMCMSSAEMRHMGRKTRRHFTPKLIRQV